MVSQKDEAVLSKLKSLKNSTPNKDWYDDLSEAYQQDIQKGLDDIANGRVVPHEQVMAKVKSKINQLKNS
ncbi:hypothetical protein [Galbibacter sp. PAP.153]|uniref:hypothetical protein n=1 Tax=Galbibacter sp. PAP.153 TaxID=3104623 RepID=UPI00300BA0D7